MKACVLPLFCFVTFAFADEYHAKKPSNFPLDEVEGSSDFWKVKAQNYLAAKLNAKVNTKKAKNIIMFLGDGMGLSTVSAARMYVEHSEDGELSFEKFPYFGLSRTYCFDTQVPDSACTATAYLNGVKAVYETIGVKPNVKARQCFFDERDKTESIASWAQKAGKGTGIVTTTRVTHASPAGVYAHVAFRDWENDVEIRRNCNSSNFVDIAQQLVYEKVGKNLKVILGGGRQNFINTTEIDEEGRPGLRTDGKNLIEDWIRERNEKGNAKYIWHKQQLNEIDFGKTDYLMGLFESGHCMFNLDILENNLQHQEPSLTDMTVAAIKMLQKEKNGYFLFVEGGMIDYAHHDNNAKKAMEETKEFSLAIDAARRLTNEDDTLIVVTSDHSHVFTYGGSSERGAKVLGFGGNSDMDNKPYLSFSYGNGPAYNKTYNKSERVNLSNKNLHSSNFLQSSTVPLEFDTHAGEDVGVFASGPYSHFFTGSFEQNNIPVLMAYAARIGPYHDGKTYNSGKSSSEASNKIIIIIMSIVWKFILK